MNQTIPVGMTQQAKIMWYFNAADNQRSSNNKPVGIIPVSNPEIHYIIPSKELRNVVTNRKYTTRPTISFIEVIIGAEPAAWSTRNFINMNGTRKPNRAASVIVVISDNPTASP